MIILKEIKCTYEVYEKYCKAFQEMKDKAGSYTPTENEIYQRIYPELEKYILFLLWIEMTGYDTEENKKNRQIICTILKEELKYSKSHEWVALDGDLAVVGLTDYAQSELGDLVFVNLPEVGDTVEAGEVFGDVESVKAVSDVYSPVTGEVTEINEELLDSPELINDDAYEAWFIKVKDVSATEELLTAEEYKAFVESEQE